MIRNKYDYNRKGETEEAVIDLDNPVDANAGDSNMVFNYLTEENEKSRGYDILLLNCGLHDIKVDPLSGKRQTEASQYKTNLSEIVCLAKAMSQNLIWINSTLVIDKIHNTEVHSIYTGFIFDTNILL